MDTAWFRLAPLALVVSLVGWAGSASAGSLIVELDPFAGDDVTLELTLDDDAGDGTIHGRLEVTEGVGDLRGLFLDLAETGLLAGLEVSGDHVTGFDTGGVIHLPQGNNVNGGGTPCPCDVGITFGMPGIGRDDLDAVEFVLSHMDGDLDPSIFRDQYVGARVTSVGLDHDAHEGSSKLVGVVPEPATATLLGLGGALLGLRRRSVR